MREIIATITSKGQLTLPAEVRHKLDVTIGDKVSFVLADDGTISIKPVRYRDVASIAGAAGALPEPLSWEEMRRIAWEDHLAEEAK